MMWTHAWVCRVFVAQREGYNNTYTPFVDLYAADDTECTSQEVGLCSQLSTHVAPPPCHAPHGTSQCPSSCTYSPLRPSRNTVSRHLLLYHSWSRQPYLLTMSLSHWLTHSPTHSLAHSLTHSLFTGAQYSWSISVVGSSLLVLDHGLNHWLWGHSAQE